MKTLTFALAVALILGTTTFSFAGNHPAVTYPAGKFATTGGNTQVTPWNKGSLQYPGGVVVAKAENGVCPVMGHKITSKHNAVVVLSNGKHMTLCCVPCKQSVEQNLAKYQDLMY